MDAMAKPHPLSVVSLVHVCLLLALAWQCQLTSAARKRVRPGAGAADAALLQPTLIPTPTVPESCAAGFPQVDDTVNMPVCLTLKWVCMDQGTLISNDPEYHPTTSPKRFPQIHLSSDLVWNLPDKYGPVGDRYVRGQLPFPAQLYFRPGNILEESPDVKHPTYSNCTVPVILYQKFPFSQVETFKTGVNVMYALQKTSYYDKLTTIVLGMPPGLAAPTYSRFWFQAFTNKEVTTLSAFSSRPLPGQLSKSTGEGVPQRCFHRILLCSVTSEPWFGGRWHEAARHMREAYQEQVDAQDAEFRSRQSPKLPTGSDIMKVVFAARLNVPSVALGGKLLNEQELIKQCNKQAATIPDGSTYKKMFCFSHIFGADPLHDLWITGNVDAVVGLFGPSLVHSLFQLSGSSVIEIRQLGLNATLANEEVRYMSSNSFERPWRVFWFGIQVTQPDNSAPGILEADPKSHHNVTAYPKDRNVKLPWEALSQQLSNVASVSRKLEQYMMLRFTGAFLITDTLEKAENPEEDKALKDWIADVEAAKAKKKEQEQRATHRLYKRLMRLRRH